MPESPILTQKGSIPFTYPSIPHPCATFFIIYGDLTNSSSPPLICLHGGPGAGHDSVGSFAQLALPPYNIPIILYDQIGCGQSTHVSNEVAADASVWVEELFLAELDNLVDHFDLRRDGGPGFHLLGHSWGGSLAAAYATRRPKGLRRLVLASGLADKKLSIKGRNMVRRQFMPEDVQKVLDEGDARESEGGTKTEEYKKAMGFYLKTCMCRAGEGEASWPPEEFAKALENLTGFKAVSVTMNGNSQWQSRGTMENWTCIDRLPNITAPTLVYNGEFDTSHDIATAPFFELIPRVRWITLVGAGHMPHLEGEAMREKTMKLVGNFLMQRNEYKA